MELIVLLVVIVLVIVLVLHLVKCKHNWRTRGKGRRQCSKCSLYQYKQINGAWVDDYQNL